MNPAIDIGQVEGAFVMGLGYWTTEQIKFSEYGKVLTNNTYTYKIPVTKDIPIDFRIRFSEFNPNPAGILHSKGLLLNKSYKPKYLFKRYNYSCIRTTNYDVLFHSFSYSTSCWFRAT